MAEYELIDKQTRKVISIGDMVRTFRGEVKTLEAAYSSSGRGGKISLKGERGLLYPSVINAEFVRKE